jgi:hypothetical protein
MRIGGVVIQQQERSPLHDKCRLLWCHNNTCNGFVEPLVLDHFAFASAEQDSFPVGAETDNFYNYELK